MAYKKLIKVSNVCQVLDKSKYPATQTINGVTFTNNGDGTITVNGTATQMAVYIVSYKMHPIIGHKYLITGNPNNSGTDWYKVLFYVSTHMGEQHEKIFSVEKSDPISCYITVWNGITVSNLTFKPQLFDLTEMYGAGHEPTTIEQFRQDFPEEMYDYSPHCWLTSYKRVIVTGNETYPVLTAYRRNLTCKTKNLLVYPFRETTVTKSGVTFTDNGDGSLTIDGKLNEGVIDISFTFFVGKAFKVDGAYTMSYKLLSGNTTSTQSNAYIQMYYTSNSGTSLFTQTLWLKDSDNEIAVNMSGKLNRCVIYIKPGAIFNNYRIRPMINAGSTATEYVPYGHL